MLLTTVLGFLATAGAATAPLAQALPSGYGYELVSPPDKDFGEIAQTQGWTRSDPSGSKLTYISTKGFAGSPSSPKVVQYLAERGAEGWETSPLMPPADPLGSGLGGLFASEYRWFSEDLSVGILRATDPPLAPGASAGTNHLYLRATEDGGYELVAQAPTGADILYQPFFADASADARHVIFESNAALTSDAPDDQTVKLYESVEGQVRLAGVLPNGDPAPGGSIAGTGAGQFIQYANRLTTGTLSEDGSRVIFTAAPNSAGEGQIYVRDNGTTTLHASASQRTIPDPAGPLPAKFGGASSDGSVVFFTTAEQLVDDDDDAAVDLYRYQVTTNGLMLLSTSDGMGVGGVVNISDDGGSVYFEEGGGLYLWRDEPGGGGLILVRSGVGGSDNYTLFGDNYTFGRESSITADGRYLLFALSAQGEVDLYDSETDTLICLAACNPAEGRKATLKPWLSGVVGNFQEYEPRSLTDDGSKALFSTNEALVAEDTNGRYDVYEYDIEAAVHRLISSGRSADDSWFLDANADGSSVFFTTRERLVGWDRDNSADAYVARDGGGFAEPSSEPAPCSGDDCRPATGARPSGGEPASEDLVGEGDPALEARATFSVRGLSAAALAKAARTGRLAVAVRVSRAGRVSAVARARIAGRRVVVGRASRVARGAGALRLTVRLSGRARARLAAGRELRAALAVRFSGARQQQTRALVLRRSK